MREIFSKDESEHMWRRILALVESGGGGSVTGVKGNEESTYRTGNVNLTAANVGALPSDYSGLTELTAPATGDILPIEHNGTTYKIDYDKLAAAIIAQVTPTGIGAVSVADVINNLTSTATNKPLSAAQGKYLAENTMIRKDAKYSTFSALPTEPGEYNIGHNNGATADADSPLPTSTAAIWWNVLQYGTSTRLMQIASNAYGHDGRVWVRMLHDTTWYGWYELSNYNALKPADVVNNLTSGGTAVPLSAEMGKDLNTSLSSLISQVGAIHFTTIEVPANGTAYIQRIANKQQRGICWVISSDAARVGMWILLIGASGGTYGSAAEVKASSVMTASNDSNGIKFTSTSTAAQVICWLYTT